LIKLIEDGDDVVDLVLVDKLLGDVEEVVDLRRGC